jgi:hypothetical protein
MNDFSYLGNIYRLQNVAQNTNLKKMRAYKNKTSLVNYVKKMAHLFWECSKRIYIVLVYLLVFRFNIWCETTFKIFCILRMKSQTISPLQDQTRLKRAHFLEEKAWCYNKDNLQHLLRTPGNHFLNIIVLDVTNLPV